MGLEVPATVSEMEFKPKLVEYHFARALAIFWPFFEKTLHEQRIITFNRTFLLLGNENTNTLTKHFDLAASAYLHVFIDEFQDISPQIVAWVKTMQTRLTSLQPSSPISIMAIGDDWQSIYGWRGSTPDFFINFDNHFPIHPSLGGAASCHLVENFRSVKEIVDDAEKLLQNVHLKTDKKTISLVSPKKGDHGVHLFHCDDFSHDNLRLIADIIMEQYALAKRTPLNKIEILVMSRTNDLLEQIRSIIGKKNGLSYHTYHSAKGLQGNVAIMLDDCCYNVGNLFRNQVYKISNLFGHDYTYDDAMKDEAFRLAYVGITRGMRRVFWITSNNESCASSASIKMGATIKPLTDVRNNEHHPSDL